LIGRLLYDTDSIYTDQLASVRKASRQGEGEIDLSLITDGLKAEREQAITIDVAYRYFSTAKRNFIIADTPGHEQYTRNMVTGASTADLAVLLVDVRKGILAQTRRHVYILWLLGIRQLVLAVNKMDLVDYDEQAFAKIQASFLESTSSMEGLHRYFVPVSALAGDNIVAPSQKMPWYSGPSLIELLEEVPVDPACDFENFRFPVQSVVRPDADFRGYAGQIVSGIAKPGQEILTLPSGQRTRIKQVILHKRILKEAFPSQSVLLTLDEHIDLGRGDMLVDPRKPPIISNRLTAELIWISECPLKTNAPYLIKHTTQVLCGSILSVRNKVDIHSFSRLEAHTLLLNEIGIVEIETHKAMFFDPYSINRPMGSFIMIDATSGYTVAAGLLSERATLACEAGRPPANSYLINNSSHGLTVWFTGLSGAGKTTLCNAVATELLAHGFNVEILDGDVVRKKLNSDLGFSPKDREENIRRIGFVAQLLSRHGVIVLVAAISPYRAVREELRSSMPDFIEVYVNAPLMVCEQRDPKGLYRRVREKEIKSFTGVDDPYQPPLAPDVECKTDCETIKGSANKVITAVLARLNSLDHASHRQYLHSDSDARLPLDGSADPSIDAGATGLEPSKSGQLV
jgi:bifunctional enzyme CysN/CysC